MTEFLDWESPRLQVGEDVKLAELLTSAQEMQGVLTITANDGIAVVIIPSSQAAPPVKFALDWAIAASEECENCGRTYATPDGRRYAFVGFGQTLGSGEIETVIVRGDVKQGYLPQEFYLLPIEQFEQFKLVADEDDRT